MRHAMTLAIAEFMDLVDCDPSEVMDVPAGAWNPCELSLEDGAWVGGDPRD